MKCKNCGHPVLVYDVDTIKYCLHYGAVLYCQSLGCYCSVPKRSEDK